MECFQGSNDYIFELNNILSQKIKAFVYSPIYFTFLTFTINLFY